MWCWMWDRRSLGFPLCWPCSAPKGLTLSWQETHLPEPGITLLLKVTVLLFVYFVFLNFGHHTRHVRSYIFFFPANTDGIMISSDPHQPESNQFHPQPCWMGPVFKRRPFSPHKTPIHSILFPVNRSSLAGDGSWRGPRMLHRFHACPGPTPQFQKAYWNSRLNVKRRVSNPLYQV